MVRSLRSAFTLVELLVVIAIIGVLVGLLLPAVQSARESARRLQCSNNLKQLGLAVANYESALRKYPLTTTGATPSSAGCGNGFYSWLALILPFIEQQSLYNSIDFSTGMMDQCRLMASADYKGLTISNRHVNARAAATVVPGFICPSDAYSLTAALGTAQVAPGSYAGNIGWIRYTTGISGTDSPLMKHNGALPLVNPHAIDPWQNGAISERDFADGLSNTTLIAERRINSGVSIPGPFGPTMNGQFDDSVLSFCAAFGSSRSLPSWITYCEGATPADPAYSIPHGKAWISGWTLAANLYTHVMPPNRKNCHVYGGEDNGTNVVTASSRHTGGVMVAFCDGHVQFISEGINLPTWWSLGSRNGGEVVSGEF